MGIVMEARKSPPVLQVQGVDIRYGGNLVVSGASFDVREGEFVTLLGPSGSGKTSLLRTIAGFMPASAGQIRLRGEPMEKVPAYQRDVGLVFQNYGLFPHMTVAGNLSFGPRMMKVPAARSKPASPRSSLKSGWSGCGSGIPMNCPAASSSAWPSRGRWPCGLRCCSWTSRCPTWTRGCVPRCAWSCSSC